MQNQFFTKTLSVILTMSMAMCAVHPAIAKQKEGTLFDLSGVEQSNTAESSADSSKITEAERDAYFAKYRQTTEETNEVQKAVYEVLPILEDILQAQYDNLGQQIRQQIKEHDWDLDYTLLSFNQTGNPLKEVNYTEIIAAYATVVDLGRQGKPIFSDIPFITMTTKEQPVPGDESVKYGEVAFHVMSAEDVLKYYGYDSEENKELYANRLSILKQKLNGDEPQDSVFINTPSTLAEILNPVEVSEGSIASLVSDAQLMQIINGYGLTTSDEEAQRSNIVLTALSLVGRVPYEWGGKASKGGYDNTWWTIDSSGKQKGLDCSGFVQWVYMTCGYDSSITNGLISTMTIRHALTDISKEELQPGDIGLMNDTDSSLNHTGIYLGNGLWIHCASSKGTVVVNDFNFKYYKRAPIGNIAGNSLNWYNKEVQYTNGESYEAYRTAAENCDAVQYTEEEATELAQLIEHEAAGEGFNGWVAIGEIVYNRVKSDAFPNTVSEVLFQSGQFTTKQELSKITPRTEVLDVAKACLNGTLKVLGNENVVFYKNPTITDGLAASDPVDWGNYKWYTSIGHHAFYLYPGADSGRTATTNLITDASELSSADTSESPEESASESASAAKSPETPDTASSESQEAGINSAVEPALVGPEEWSGTLAD